MGHCQKSPHGPACNGQMDCPCPCNFCNGAARLKLVKYVQDLTQNEAVRLKPHFEQLIGQKR